MKPLRLLGRRLQSAQLAYLFCASCIVSASSIATAQVQQTPKIDVAIVGAIAGEPAVYEVSLEATIEQVLSRVGGLTDSATGQFRILRGQTGPHLVETAERTFRLQNGDAIVAIDSVAATRPDRTLVIVSAYGRPLVARLPVNEVTEESLRQRLAVPAESRLSTFPSLLAGPLPDGIFVLPERMSSDVWQWLAASLPVKSLAEQTALQTQTPPQIVQTTPQIIESPATALAPPAFPREDSDLIEIAEPASLPEPSSVAMGPLSLPPAQNFEAYDEPLAALVGPSEPMDPTRVPGSVFEFNGADSTTPYTLSLSETSPQVAPAIDVTEISENATPRPLVAEQITVGLDASDAAPPTLAESDSSAASVNSNGLIYLAAGIVFIVGGVYLVVQPSQVDESTPVATGRNTRSGSLEQIGESTIVQEDAPVELPMSLQGKAVALGKLRIDAAHDGPSGPHFRSSNGTPNARRQRIGRETAMTGDVLGRALSAMERERS